MSFRAAIALGSNLASAWGDRAATLDEAVRQVGALGQVTAVSPWIETTPVDYLDQPPFFNGALLLETELPPLELLRALLDTERAMGRDRSADAPVKGPRVVDLDLLLVDDLVIHSPDLTLPHPAMAMRRFVLEPLAAIAPGWHHPVLQVTVAGLLASLRD